VETVTSKLQETGHQLVKQGDAFITRTREAGEAFITETRDAGLEFVGFVQLEAKKWRRFVTLRATRIQADARETLSIPGAERQLLTRVDGTLKTIDQRVRTRLTALEKAKGGRAPRRLANGKAHTAAPRKAKPAAALHGSRSVATQ
jgi:hypothetical protein